MNSFERFPLEILCSPAARLVRAAQSSLGLPDTLPSASPETRSLLTPHPSGVPPGSSSTLVAERVGGPVLPFPPPFLLQAPLACSPCSCSLRPRPSSWRGAVPPAPGHRRELRGAPARGPRGPLRRGRCCRRARPGAQQEPPARRTRDPMWNTYGYPSPTAKGGWVYLTGGDASYTEGDSGGAFLQTGGRARLTRERIGQST